MPVSVGSFAKSTGAAPAAQNVAHGLGVTPKALILLQSGVTAVSGFGSHGWAYTNIGITDENMDSFFVGTGSEGSNAVTSDNASGTGAYALAFAHQVAGTVAFNAGTITAWDDTNFTVTWNPNYAVATIIGFIAIGGTGVQSKLVIHSLDGDTGADPIVGAGFKPTLAIMLNAGNVTAAMPSSTAHANLGIGMCNSSQQWGVAYEATDGLATTDTKAAQRTDNCLLALSNTEDSLTYSWLGAFSSFDNDGMTLNVGTAGTANSRLGVLFLKGVNSDLSAFTKDSTGTDPSLQTVTSSVTPQTVILAGFHRAATTSVSANAFFGMGASNETAEFSISTSDENNKTETNCWGAIFNTKAFSTVANATETVTAECDIDLKVGAFDVNWTTNDTRDDQILYAALTTLGGGGGGGGGGQGGGHGGGNGGGNGGGGNPGGGPPGQGGGGSPDSRVFQSTPRKKRKFFAGF
jgi:hypothetical protein